MNFWLLASLFVGTLAFTACSSGSDDDGGGGGQPGGGGIIPSVQPVNPSDMKMAALSGFVLDGTYPIRGVKVVSGTAETTTNANGAFTLPQVNVKNGRAVVKFTHSGYIDVVRSAEFKEGDVWDVQMKYKQTGSFSSTSPYSAEVSYGTGMRIEIPANSVAKADGTEYSGQVNTESTYLNPNDENFASQMPGGDLVGIGNPEAGGGVQQLISYGMVSMSLTDDSGNPLQLKEGSSATLTFPAVSGLEAYDEIPLWYFDEETGVWVHEGTAYKQADGTYKGDVSHFSWHNLDYPESRANISVHLQDTDGKPIARQRVVIGQGSGTTDASGNYSGFVPTNTDFKVTVKSFDYADYSPEVFSENIRITTAGATQHVTLVLPKLAHLSGTITSGGVGTQASVSVSYSHGETKSVMTAVDGKFIVRLPASATGAATLNILAADGTTYRHNIILTGGDLTQDFEINPPVEATGTVTFTSDDGSFSVVKTIKDVPAYSFAGALILGNEMTAMSSSSSASDEYVNFSIYSSGSSFSWYDEATSEQISTRGSTGFNLTYSFVDGKIKVEVSGAATYRQNYNTSEISGTISGSFPYSILAIMNQTDGSTSPASWVPTVAGATPKYGYTITGSPKIGDSWVLFYNNGETADQFNTLVAAAKATFGEPWDSTDDEWNKYYIFVKGTQSLYLGYNSSPQTEWTPEMYNIFNGHHGWSENAITIRAFSNVTASFDEVFGLYHK